MHFLAIVAYKKCYFFLTILLFRARLIMQDLYGNVIMKAKWVVVDCDIK